MIKPLHLSVAALALLLAAGCSAFSKKSSKPKESSAIASETEETYRKRWVDKRITELAAQGVTAEAARTQAETEFREKYGFNEGKKK